MEKLDKKLAILEAGVKVFNEKGFHGATTKEIAREAGIAEGTIFRYFPTKKEILNQILFQVVDQVISQFLVDSLERAVLENQDKAPEEAVQAILKKRLELCIEHFNLIKVVLTEAQFHPDLMDIQVNKILLPIKRQVEGYLMDGIQSGVFREIDVSILASCFTGLLFSMIINHQFLNQKADRNLDEDIAKMVDILFYGIRKERAE